MGAILKSGAIRFFASALALALALTSLGEESRFEVSTNFLAHAKAAFESAHGAYATNRQHVPAMIDFARCAFDYADLAPNDDKREELATAGIEAARAAIASDGKSAAGHYYLALNIGQLARTKMLGALRLLTEMEAELKRVLELDKTFDYAGGDRTLGVLYLEAPGWPTSVGSKSKARMHLTRALELAPEFPDNQISLMEAYLKWKDWRPLQEQMASYQKMLPSAREKFKGQDWANEWHDWNRRWKIIQAKAKTT